MAKMCIICGAPAQSGAPVEETQAIRIIRKIKKRLNMAANNELVVCPKHLEEHKKKRKSFERKMILYAAFGGILVLLSILLPVFSSRPVEIASVAMIAILALFLAGLAMLSYMPPLKGAGAGEKGKKEGSASGAVLASQSAKSGNAGKARAPAKKHAKKARPKKSGAKKPGRKKRG